MLCKGSGIEFESFPAFCILIFQLGRARAGASKALNYTRRRSRSRRSPGKRRTGAMSISV